MMAFYLAQETTNITALLIIYSFGFLTTIATLLYQGYQRKLDREDARASRARLEKATDDIAKKTEEGTNSLQDLVVRATAELALKTLDTADAVKHHTTVLNEKTNTYLAEVGDLAKSAYHEANQVNIKIADLHQASIEKGVVADRKLVHIDKIGLDTNERVRSLENQSGTDAKPQ